MQWASGPAPAQHFSCRLSESKDLGHKAGNGTEHKLDCELDWPTDRRSTFESTKFRWQALPWRATLLWTNDGAGSCSVTWPLETADSEKRGQVLDIDTPCRHDKQQMHCDFINGPVIAHLSR